MYRASTTLGLLLIATLAPAENTGNHKLDVFDLLSAEWADNRDYSCAENPHVITFSKDRKLATFTYLEPPDRSHWSSSYHGYHLSPEESTETKLVFYVLDHGRNWLALQRTDALPDRNRGVPPRWKISLMKDDTNYRWHLYGAAFGNNSLLRGVRCTPESKILKEKSEAFSHANLDPTLARLVGHWEAPGRVMGRPVTYRAKGSAVLQGSFIRIELRDLTVPARYEAIILVGKSERGDAYVAHWLDVLGVDSSSVIGSGTYDDNELTLQFEQAENTIVNTFRFRRSIPLRADRFDLVTLSIEKATQAVSETASYEFKRVEAP